jgi:hypothetical protein
VWTLSIAVTIAFIALEQQHQIDSKQENALDVKAHIHYQE